MKIFSALIAGVLFGLGLAISGMMNPAKVVNFLDITGTWDPSLALVMGGALILTIPGFKWVTGRSMPAFDGQFHLPTRKDIDTRLVLGAVLFGIGWALVGLCPGPVLAALITLKSEFWLFAAAMILGNWFASKL
ncbi:MAG: DUF6691 family protein [Spongiibacteraceae bacterium]